jgi:hypothetical protein
MPYYQSWSNLFQRTAEREPFIACHGVDPGHFGFGYFIRISAADSGTFEMDVQHDPVGLGGRFAKNGDQRLDNELHGRVIIIVHQDRKHWRPPGAGLALHVSADLIVWGRFRHALTKIDSVLCDLQEAYINTEHRKVSSPCTAGFDRTGNILKI